MPLLRPLFGSVAVALWVVFMSALAMAAGPVSQADAMAAIEQTRPGAHFVWHEIRIDPARNATVDESGIAGMPYPVVVHTVRAVFTADAGLKRDVTWNYYLYQDASGRWVAASNAIKGNQESAAY